jgi:hypothetical protein
MENKIMFIHIENGNFDGEEFLDVLSGIYRETEDSFEKDRGSISAFYKAVENKEKKCFVVNSLVLMSRFMTLGVLRDVFTDVAYYVPKCYGSDFKSGYVKMYVFTNTDNVYEYRLEISNDKFNIKFAGIDENYKERMIKSEEKCSNIK